mgnify:CR=1 FL=1
MNLTLDQWKTFAAKFLTDRGMDVQADDWTDIEIAIHHNAGYQGISKRFLLMAAQLIREDNQS